ncbi:XRE family transcriptional regulator [Metabacillus halosaccharovorans]|uniref:XRE family transcriptional regulator n=1 Tax=Metabacillus halosaccharovorans TaxID=930124 RepID=UPI00203C1BF3|nr:XRE family transcriptional regulator [Metabacillus halosaccharovorans]MCM3444401.1 XRE family transcriptional regulator [Metabacillus halosaccharovorans]
MGTLRIALDEVLKDRELTQKELINLIKEKKDRDVRAAAISELYNNQRKSWNKELLELIVDVLEIEDISLLIKIDK